MLTTIPKSLLTDCRNLKLNNKDIHVSKVYPLYFGKHSQPASVQNMKFDFSKYQNIINKRRQNKTIAENYKENAGVKSTERMVLPLSYIPSRIESNYTLNDSTFSKKADITPGDLTKSYTQQNIKIHESKCHKVI